MTFIKEILIGIECDNCKELFCDEYHEGYTFFTDENGATERASETQWFIEDEKHYCPKCHTINEDDSVTFKSN